MLRPANRVDQARGALPSGVGADRLRDAQELLLFTTADSSHHLRRIARIVLPQKVEHTARVLEGGILFGHRVIERTRALLVVPGIAVATASIFARVLPGLVLRVVLALLVVIAAK